MVSHADETIDAYNAIAPVYGEYSSQRGNYLEAIEKLVIQSIRPGARLLDVGAGDGRRLAKIRDSVALTEIVAIEPSPEMARICREKTNLSVHQSYAENINKLNIGTFDIITALWNVFGHVTTSEFRLSALCHMREKLVADGIIMLDVNNRHNASAYGVFTVIKRIFIDALAFNETRGNASYEWKIGNKCFQASGHLFTPNEIENIIQKAKLRVKFRYSVNYATGEVSKSKFRGQLFYILCKA